METTANGTGSDSLAARVWVAVAGHADEFTVDNHHLASKVGEGTKSEITVRPQVADRHCLVLDPSINAFVVEIWKIVACSLPNALATLVAIRFSAVSPDSSACR